MNAKMESIRLLQQQQRHVSKIVHISLRTGFVRLTYFIQTKKKKIFFSIMIVEEAYKGKATMLISVALVTACRDDFIFYRR